MPILFDTSFLLAVSWPQDSKHTLARSAMQSIRTGRVIAAPMLPELFYMLATRTDYQTAVSVFEALQSAAFQIEPLMASDMARMAEIMNQYADNRFDYVDTALMALSERLNITEVYTFDRRDFSAFRPIHTIALRLLP